MLETTKSNVKKDDKNISVSLNIPRYIEVKENKNIVVKCDALHFKEDYFYVSGSWKLTLVKYKDDYRLKKEKV